MAYSEITAADLLNKGVEGLPDTPGLTAAQMQQKFDEIAKDVIVPKFNAVVQKLNDPSGADDIQVTDPTTGTQNNLNDALGNIETENAANTLARHTHDNKATLDDIDATVKAAYDRLVTLLGAITGIQSVLSSSTAELPDAKAVADAIATVQTEVSLNTAARHTHANKATLDDITALVKQGYDDLVTLLTGITGIETTLTNSNDKIPRSDAVYTAVDNLSAIVAANTAARHTHANKATLDAIDATTKTAYDGLVTLLTGITTVVNTVTDNTAYIPTCHAIVDYVSSLGGGDMLKSVYDTNNDGTVDAADYATAAGNATTADSATFATSAGDSTRLGGQYSSFYATGTDVTNIKKMLGNIQTTAVATKAYSVGDFLTYNDKYYEVTQAIAMGGTITPGTNVTERPIGDVLTALGADSGGHVIKNQTGTDLAQEPALQFKDAHTSDDGVNSKTVVQVAKTVTMAQWLALPTDGTADGFYIVDDGYGQGLEAQNVAYDNSVSGMTATNTQAAIDELNADKANEIITDTVTASAESVSANTSKVFQIACTKAGYTPIGISTYTITGTYNDEVSVYRVDFVSDKSTVVVGCRNMHAGANSIGAKVVILYQKN